MGLHTAEGGPHYPGETVAVVQCRLVEIVGVGLLEETVGVVQCPLALGEIVGVGLLLGEIVGEGRILLLGEIVEVVRYRLVGTAVGEQNPLVVVVQFVPSVGCRLVGS